MLPAVYLARDHPESVVAARVGKGEWLRVRPGAFVDATHARDPARRRIEALARIVAVRAKLSLPYCLSHESAALIWGLPLLTVPDQTHVIQQTRPRAGSAADIVRHVHRLPDDHRTVHRGFPTTSLERTLVDCAMSLRAQAGVIVADAGLAIGADRDRCLDILAGMRGRRGAPLAREVLDLADDGAESPGESSLRFAFLRAGLPVPETQIAVRTRLGTFWGDLGWREWRLLVEYDGRAKYSLAGGSPEALVAEKRRQEAIEEEGWRVLRAVKEDLREPDRLLARVARYAPPGAMAGLRRRRLLG